VYKFRAISGSAWKMHSLTPHKSAKVKLSAAQWDAEVAKMIRAMGAPIDEADGKAIADYLKKNYGS